MGALLAAAGPRFAPFAQRFEFPTRARRAISAAPAPGIASCNSFRRSARRAALAVSGQMQAGRQARWTNRTLDESHRVALAFRTREQLDARVAGDTRAAPPTAPEGPIRAARQKVLAAQTKARAPSSRGPQMSAPRQDRREHEQAFDRAPGERRRTIGWLVATSGPRGGRGVGRSPVSAAPRPGAVSRAAGLRLLALEPAGARLISWWKLGASKWRASVLERAALRAAAAAAAAGPSRAKDLKSRPAWSRSSEFKRELLFPVRGRETTMAGPRAAPPGRRRLPSPGPLHLERRRPCARRHSRPPDQV